MALTRKTSIQTLIDTNLASGKTPKISPADHLPVAEGIINYIDNRVLVGNSGVIFAGFKTFTTGGADYNIEVLFGTEVSTLDYVVVGCITSTSVGENKCRHTWMIKDKSTSSFKLVLRAPYPATATTLTFEYLLFAEEEVL